MGAHGAPGGYSTECYAMILRHNDSGSQSLLRASIESSKLWFIFGKTHRATMDVSDTLPDDIDALRALLLAERDKLVARDERLEAIIAEIRARISAVNPSASPTTSCRSRWRSSRPCSPRRLIPRSRPPQRGVPRQPQ